MSACIPYLHRLPFESGCGPPPCGTCRECGCGSGDSGCEECGCCRTCACEEDYDAEVAAWNRVAAAPVADGAAAGAVGGGLDNKQAKVVIFDVRYKGGRRLLSLFGWVRSCGDVCVAWWEWCTMLANCSTSQLYAVMTSLRKLQFIVSFGG